MSDHPDARLQRLLGGDHLGALRKRLRHRFERAPAEDVALIRVGDLSADEHSTLALLTGRPQRLSSSLKIDVRSVDAALQRSGVAASLRDALEKLDGPIVHRATERQRLEGLWSGVAAGCNHAGLAGLLRAAGVDTILVTGVTATACVRTTICDGLQEGFRTIAVRECIGDRVPGAVEWNLFDIDAKFADVESVDTCVAYLNSVNRRNASADG